MYSTEIELGCEIDSGKSGTVYVARSKEGTFAIKKIPYDKVSILEITILLTIRHPSLLEGYYCIPSLSDIYIITELASYDTRTPPSNENYELWKIQLISAVACLHQNNIIHGDIKPSNILFFENENKITLGDFGSSIIDRNYYYTHPVGTPRYSPIELTTKGKKFFQGWGKEIDIWAVGCTLYYYRNEKHFISQRNLVRDNKNLEDKMITNFLLDWNKKNKGKNPFKMYNVPFIPIDEKPKDPIIFDCLQFYPEDRITAEDLLAKITKEVCLDCFPLTYTIDKNFLNDSNFSRKDRIWKMLPEEFQSDEKYDKQIDAIEKNIYSAKRKNINRDIINLANFLGFHFL